MAKPYVMRQTHPRDVDSVMAIVHERAEWLGDRGSEQWNRGKDYQDTTVRRIELGQCWLLEDDGVPIGTASYRRRGRSALWTAEELAQPALYGWKMATIVERNGQGLGKLILAWLQDRAAVLDKRYMRWTAAQSNHQLHAYYASVGAELVRVVEVADRVDGALFQLPAVRVAGLGAHVLTELDQTRAAESPGTEQDRRLDSRVPQRLG